MTLLPRLALALLAAGLSAPGRLRAADPVDTIVESSGPGEMVSTDTETTMTWHDHVVVTGNNLKIYCDSLKVVASRKGDPTATLGKYGYFKSLLATGHVRIVQGDREATCGRAEIFPGDDKIVLTEQPLVRSLDDQYIATGQRLILFHGERRAVIEGTPEERTHMTLPAIKDLGFDNSKPATPGDGAPAAK
jgi:lipopolysaccharide export system protein LptA